MKIIYEDPVKVFKKTFEERDYYRIGLSKKDKEGKYVNGYLEAKFRKDAKVDDSKKIYIKDAWLDFYKAEDKTRPYIFINQFDYVEDVAKPEPKDPFQEFSEEFTDDMLPF